MRARVRVRNRAPALHMLAASGAAPGGYLQWSKSDGDGGAGTWGPSDGSGVWRWGRTPPFPDDNTVQTLPDWIGETSGELNTGHMMYYPLLAEKLYIVEHGTSSSPTLAANAANAALKAAMQAGDIPWGVVLYLNLKDPDDVQNTDAESWGVDAADGSFDYEQMSVFDAPAHIEGLTGIDCSPENVCCIGFSEGGFITSRKHAKYGAAHAAVFVVIDAPREDADIGGAASTYNSWSAVLKAKLWANSSATMQANSPFSSISGTGLYESRGGGWGWAPLLMIRSTPGGASPPTNSASMNAAETQLAANGVDHSAFNAGGGTLNHSFLAFMQAWAAETSSDANGDKMDIGWIKRAAVRAGYSW